MQICKGAVLRHHAYSSHAARVSMPGKVHQSTPHLADCTTSRKLPFSHLQVPKKLLMKQASRAYVLGMAAWRTNKHEYLVQDAFIDSVLHQHVAACLATCRHSK
ncbi:uncharacterized protein LOC119396942 isoform X2 [Rhipicephalus sanguineus]|uniref:uncharacterized protein LOC119396942 isoform X2 n=1 Tax=Rhipicephalus sanguineus TaxID=34632 RepID=UPI001895F4DB|nr:uncharacterized protein LOC119396942 isoform X2 [Rhipicephalus sanguineus]